LSSDVANAVGCDVTTIAKEGQSRVVCSVTDDPSPGPDSRWLSTPVSIFVDRTAPAVTGAVADRPPEATGWYRAPLTVSFAGTDATSGIASCTTAPYAGPDSASAVVAGVCADAAGNLSGPVPFGFRYDATPPAFAGLRAAPGDRVVRLLWQLPPDAVSVKVVRSPGRRGRARSIVLRGLRAAVTDARVRNGRRYTYRLRAVDAAGNVAVAKMRVVPHPRLLSPGRGEVVTGLPTLAWTPVRGARYYNVQLFRHGRRILSAWPARPRLALQARWRYAGRRHRLVRGRYRWYVWPGRGGRSASRYGALVGRRGFVVAAN
jgi:hypothetical protein